MLGVTETLGADLTAYTVPPPAPSTMGVVFVYDVHVAEGAQRKGLAKHLVRGRRANERAEAGA